MKIYLDKVEENKKDILYRLLEYSLFEESLTDGNEMNEEGIFEYKYFEQYFKENSREAFFVREKDTNKLLGFVMINEYIQKSDQGKSIAEFMIIPKYRRKGVGKEVAFQCFERYKGYWEVSPSLGSESAYQFWFKVVKEYTDNHYTYEQGIFNFNNKK